MSDRVEAVNAVDWFGSFRREERVVVIGAIVNAFAGMDPTWERCVAIWGRGKTVRMTAQVPVGGRRATVGIHLSVEDADLRLLRSLTARLKAGTLAFEYGWLKPEGRTEDRAWLAPLGMGTLSVSGERGEIMVKASGRQPLMVPSAPDVASDVVAALPLPPAEGFVVFLFEGQLYLVGSFHGIQRDEVAAVLNAPVDVGIVPVSDGMLLFGLSVPGFIDGWADLPFSLAVERPEDRRINAPEADGTGHLVLALIDRDDGRTVALRPLRLSPRSTAVLHDLLAAQQDAAGRYGWADYGRDLEASRVRWPVPTMITESMVVRETITAPV